MDLGIRDRSALVAAGSAGLGLAIAQALAAEGVRVVTCGRDTERLEGALGSIATAATGAEPQGLTCDVGSPEGAEEFVRRGSEMLGGEPDILVCNAGGPPPGTPSGTPLAEYRRALESNCLASIAMCSAAVPAMRDRRWGRVLAITSIGAREPIDRLAASSVARAALTSYLRMLATEVASDGVTVNNLQPGLHRTARMDDLAGDQLRALLEGLPAGRLGEPAEFGALGAFLCSESAGFTTGVGLHTDGGAFRGLQ